FVDITGNRISTLKKDTFVNLTLHIITLTNNRIRVIEDEAFLGLPNLKIIFLANNRLITLNPNSFKRVPKLNLLDLHSNKVGVLEERSFGFVEMDTCVVNLGNNEIKSIDVSVFEGLIANDIILSFQQNLIQNVSMEIFGN